MKVRLLIITLFIVCVVFAILPLLHHGFFMTDDGEWMVIRSHAFYLALHDGQFPVRFLHHLNYDYGYPVATFLYPGFFYAGVFFQALKFNALETTKILFGISLIGSAIFTYFWLNALFKQRLASFVGALLALYMPYHLYDAYTRGSAGELFALLWVPFILWMIERKNIFFTSIGIFLLILSHNTLAALYIPILFIYALLRKTFSLKYVLLTFVLGIALSSFFILPILYELPLTRFSQTDISMPQDYFADFNLMGMASIGIYILTLMLFVFRSSKISGIRAVCVFFLGITTVTILLSSSLGSSLWNVLPHEFIQFPFRLLAYFVITIPFLAAFSITQIRGIPRYSLAIVCLILGFVSAIPYSTPKKYFTRDEGYYATIQPTTTVQDEYMPLWVKQKPLIATPDKVFITKGKGKITHLFYNNKQLTFIVDSNTQVTVKTRLLYWPGWKVSIDGNPWKVAAIDAQGGMDVVVPSGHHTVLFSFGETKERLFSDILSVIAFVALLIVTKFYKVKK
jgi:hypothetical protein